MKGGGVLRRSHAHQKVEITHREKTDRQLQRSRIAKSEKIRFHRVLISYFYWSRKAKTLNPVSCNNPFPPSSSKLLVKSVTEAVLHNNRIFAYLRSTWGTGLLNFFF